MGESEHTMLEREVADIIISLLHHQGSHSGRRFRRRYTRAGPSDFFFPRWSVKRKRSVLAPAHVRSSHVCGDNEEPLSISSSNTLITSCPSIICKDSSYEPASSQKSSKINFVNKEPQAVVPASDQYCPNVMEACFNMEILERGILFWPHWIGGGRGREFVLPDLNMSAEELVPETADAELRQRQHELYETACRKFAAADARRRRRELQKLKNSIAAGSPLCSRVR